MKIGDLVMWSGAATGWSDGPEEGEIAGILVRRLPRRKKRREGRALTPERVEVLDFEGDYFIVRSAMVEMIK